MNNKRQIVVLVLVLLALGLSAVTYKHYSLGFPLVVNTKQPIWKIEAKIEFVADGGPVTVRLSLPKLSDKRKTSYFETIAPDYIYREDRSDDKDYAVWVAENKSGPQTLYLLADIFYESPISYRVDIPEPPEPPQPPTFDKLKQVIAEDFVNKLKDLSFEQKVLVTLSSVNAGPNGELSALLNGYQKVSEQLTLVQNLLALQGIPSQVSKGIFLNHRRSNQSAKLFLEVYDGNKWLLFSNQEEKQLNWNDVILMQKGSEPLLEVFGGNNSKITFSTIKEFTKKLDASVEAGKFEKSAFVDFSIYTLPVEEQITFKLLLLIPLGALVVVVLRNLVGIRTSGTFMPILIALTFLQTSLITGLALFLIVVSVGLVIRSYLSHLNLLLVPRIASVLVFVIVIYAAIGIASYKLGIEWGLKVTFFPMIILSWTIERMSILWEEEGPKEVLIQGGGSLITAVLAYFLMSNDLVADTLFLYPELLLVVLAFIIAMGSYSGYRLSDLRRFEPMERLDKAGHL